MKIQTRHCSTFNTSYKKNCVGNAIISLWYRWYYFRNTEIPRTWKSAWLVRQQPRKQKGDAYLPDKCSNKHQRTASAMCWLWYWSLSTPNSLCVNYKHKTCTLSGGNRLTAAAKAPLLTLWVALSLPSMLTLCSVIKTSKCRVAPTHLTQSVPLCHVMAFQCYDITQDAHVRPCMFSYVRAYPLHANADSTAERPTSSTGVCWHAPTWQRGLFFIIIHHEGKMGFYKPRIIWGPQRHN